MNPCRHLLSASPPSPAELRLGFRPLRSHPVRPVSSDAFTWDDALRPNQTLERGNLDGFSRRVRDCNRGWGLRGHFLRFVVDGDVVGYIHKGFTNHLKKFEAVFDLMEDESNHQSEYVTLHSSLKTPDDKTEAVGDVIKCLGQLIPGIRNELYPVIPSFGMPVRLSLERAAAPYFGIKAYGIHMNGFVEKDGQKFLWLGKRSENKPTFPGMLDHLVAGGMPLGISCKENVIKECQEEAGIPASISSSAIPVGAVSYTDIDGYRYKRDVLFCYDLKLPHDFIPNNEDGEVGSFRLIPIDKVADIIRSTKFFKPNCNLVIIDFLFRHGYMNPDDQGYLELLKSLKQDDCS